MHRGRHALRLIEQQGLSLAGTAARMNLTVARVTRLIEREHDRRDLVNYRCDAVPVSEIQRLLEERQAADPTLSHAQVARQAKYRSRIHFERVLGYAPHSATTKAGKHYPARYSTTIDVHAAAVIVRALGIAPHEVPGL
jgi:hypothetical protein